MTEAAEALIDGLPDAHRVHLSRLRRTWGPLADISFADLLLCLPDDPAAATTGYTIVGHVRPTTSRSIYRTEVVGARYEAGERAFFDLARTEQVVVDGGMILQAPAPRIRSLSVPVRCGDDVIAVLSREFSPDEQRAPGELEMTYFFLFRRLAQMITEGTYPYPIDEGEFDEAPRVSDGLLALDASARVRFASPNSVSVLSRLGVRHFEGERLAVVGVRQHAIRRAFATRLPQGEEIELRGHNVYLRCLPIIEGTELTGAIVLVRDISELRRRDRLLLSKDALIAEIHHRVKNNLQTISSLLRLQGRRVVADEARQAIEESVRRIRSIAVVHEILSQELDDDVPFEDVVRPLVRLVEEGLVSGERPVRFEISGTLGRLPSTIATALAVTLTELMQNAVEHGFPPSHRGPAVVRLRLSVSGDELIVELDDTGVGIGPGTTSPVEGLGLTIVRNLIEQDLGGSLVFAPGDPVGTTVTIRVRRSAAP